MSDERTPADDERDAVQAAGDAAAESDATAENDATADDGRAVDDAVTSADEPDAKASAEGDAPAGGETRRDADDGDDADDTDASGESPEPAGDTPESDNAAEAAESDNAAEAAAPDDAAESEDDGRETGDIPADDADAAATGAAETDPDTGAGAGAGAGADADADADADATPDEADGDAERTAPGAAAAAAPKKPRKARRARAPRSARTGGRVHWGRGIAGGVLSLAVVGAVVGATLVDLPSIGSDPDSLTVSPQAAPAVVSCTGPLLALGRDSSAASELTVAQDSSTTVGASAGEPTSSGLAAVGVSGDADATRYELDSDGSDPASLSAAVSAELRDDDLAGFSAAACRTASMESWIVGGSTAVGNSDILLLANPGSVNATVTLTIFGGAGESAAPVEPIAIPASSQVAVPLAGIAGGEESPVVRVTAEGAPVRAALQSSQVQTLDPVGVDVQEAVTPSDTQVFPGVAITEDAIAAEATPAIVRLLSRAGGEVTVIATPAGQTSAAKTLDVDLEADTPVSAALDGLDSGRYTVTVTGADGPLVSAVWQTTGPDDESDYTWQTPSPAIESAVTVAVPDGPLAQLHLVNDGEESATVTVAGASDENTLTLAPGGSGSVRVASDSVYTIAPEGDGSAVHAVVAFRDGGSLAAMPVWPDAAASSDVTVYP